MKIKIKIPLLIILLIITFFVFILSCSSVKENYREEEVQLLTPKDFDPDTTKFVLIYQKCAYQILGKLTDVKDYFWKEKKSGNEKFLNPVLNFIDSCKENPINISSIKCKLYWGFKSCFPDLILYLIDSSKCIVYHKNKKIYFEKGVLEIDSYYGGPLYGGGTVKFYCNGVYLLLLYEWIS